MEQIALFKFLRLFADAHPALRFVHSSLNGVPLLPKQAADMAASGMTAGVWDVFVPAVGQQVLYRAVPHPQDAGTRPEGIEPCGAVFYNGLYVEMKAGKNKTTPEQNAFGNWVASQGYKCVVAYDWIQAARAIADYLDIQDPRFLSVLCQAEGQRPLASGSPLPREGKTRQ